MRARFTSALALVVAMTLTGGYLGFPTGALAKVYLYAMTEDGDLVKYDPDADRIVQFRPGVGQPYINRRNPDDDNFGPTRVLDIAGGRIASTTNVGPGVVLLDLRAGRATEIAVGAPATVEELKHLVYLRQGSRFYVQWMRKLTPTAPSEGVLTAVDPNGRLLGTTPSIIAEFRGGVLPHLDGQTFYILNQPNVLLRVDGETLAVRETYNLAAFYRQSSTRFWIADVREGRALLAEVEGARGDKFDPRIISTVDLTSRTASPRITTGLGSSDLRLLPGGRAILLQEARTADDAAGSGELHFYDIPTANKLGAVSFQADAGAILLGFHPDGRRLFIRAWNWDIAKNELKTHLVIVDVVTRTVVRDRPFQRIGVAVDFVDEP